MPSEETAHQFVKPGRVLEETAMARARQNMVLGILEHGRGALAAGASPIVLAVDDENRNSALRKLRREI